MHIAIGGNIGKQLVHIGSANSRRDSVFVEDKLAKK